MQVGAQLSEGAERHRPSSVVPGEVLDGLRVPEARVGLAGLRHCQWHWEGWRAVTYQRGVSLSFPSEAASARIASGTASSYPGTTPNARQPP